jgi:hypothetical protein
LKKYLLLILTPLLLILFACSSEPVNDFVVTYGDKNVKQIILIKNNQFKQKRIFKDADTIGVFIEAIENAEKTPSFELMLIKSDYDMVLKFDDDTEKKYLLTLKNDSKTGLLIDSEDSAYRIPTEDTTQLKEIITK